MFEKLHQLEQHEMKLQEVNKIRKSFGCSRVSMAEVVETVGNDGTSSDELDYIDIDKRDEGMIRNISNVITKEITVSEIPPEAFQIIPDQDEKYFT